MDSPLLCVVGLLLFASLSGCVSDVSSSGAYRDLIGQEVWFVEPQVLWRNPPGEARLAPYEIASDMGTYTTHERVTELDTTVPLHVVKVKRRHYLIHGPEKDHQDFLIVDLLEPVSCEQVRAEVEVEMAAVGGVPSAAPATVEEQ